MRFQGMILPPLLMPAFGHTQAIREQSGMLTETANAKVAAEVLEAKSRTAEVEVSGARKDATCLLFVPHSHCKQLVTSNELFALLFL